MDTSKPRIVIAQYSSNIGGSTISGKLLAKAFLQAGFHVHVIFGFSGPAKSIYEALGCTTSTIPHRNWLRSSSLFSFLKHFTQEKKASKAFSDAYQSLKPSLVYVNSIVSFAAARSGYGNGIPVIWHLRELFSDRNGEMEIPKILGKRFISGFIQKYSKEIITISQTVKDNILSGQNNKTHIVPNAVDDSFFNQITLAQARKELNLPLDKQIIGIPGTLRPVKGHAFLIRALKNHLPKLPNVHVAITGDLHTEHAQKVISLTSHSKQFSFLGNIVEMPFFYKSCNVICIPSFSESFGRVVIEAFASERPVVATQVGGIPEIIRHDSNGKLVNYGDLNGLSHNLLSLLSDPDESDRLAKKAFQCAKTKYSESIHNSTILKIVDKAIDKNNVVS